MSSRFIIRVRWPPVADHTSIRSGIGIGFWMNTAGSPVRANSASIRWPTTSSGVRPNTL